MLAVPTGPGARNAFLKDPSRDLSLQRVSRRTWPMQPLTIEGAAEIRMPEGMEALEIKVG